jgi:large subunit ribosomal protein L10
MSKYVKDLLTDQIKRELEGVQDLLLVNVVGLSSNSTSDLRKQLREKNIKLMVVKNSLARRATEGTELAPAFEGSAGSLAMVWGASDIVALAKEVVRLTGIKEFEKFSARGGVMGGTALKPEEVQQVSKWPSREEQLSILLGQILSPGANLVSQLTSPGGALASQIKQKSEGEDGEAEAEPAAAEAAPTAEASAAPEGSAPEASAAPEGGASAEGGATATEN